MNSTSRLHFRPTVDTAVNPVVRLSRAEFSPITLRSRHNSRLHVSGPREPFLRVSLSDRDAAQSDFLRRWQQPDFLRHAEPTLTRYRE
jgi:hypothetical protein